MKTHVHIHIHDEHEGFQSLKEKLEREGKADPGGLAYEIGVKKYGKAEMAVKAAAARKK